MSSIAMSSYIGPMWPPEGVSRRQAQEPGGNVSPPSQPPSAPSAQQAGNPFWDENSVVVRAGAGAIFALLYLVIRNNPQFAAVAVLVLLACLVARLDTRRRNLVLATLLMPSFMLGEQIASMRSMSGSWLELFGATPSATVGLGAPWLPLFLAVGLFYTPKSQSFTGKILVAMSVAVLASGVLPGCGAFILFGALWYFLFIAILVGLGVDFAQQNGTGAAHLAAARNS
jgi:hypothetical protein